VSTSAPARFVTVAELMAEYGLCRSVAYRVAARLGPRRPPAGVYWPELEVWLREHPDYAQAPEADPGPPP
jgi:hypothetical protein